jgi:hypothetical protein
LIASVAAEDLAVIAPAADSGVIVLEAAALVVLADSVVADLEADAEN